MSAGDAFSRKTEKEAHPLEEGAAGSCRVCHPGAHAQLVDQWFLKTGTARNKLKGGKPQVGSVLATGPRATSSAQPWRPSQLLKLPPLLLASEPSFLPPTAAIHTTPPPPARIPVLHIHPGQTLPSSWPSSLVLLSQTHCNLSLGSP